MRILTAIWISLCLLSAGANAQFSAPTVIGNGAQKLVQASLIADTTAVVPGKPFTVGLLLKMKPEWHTYWKYAGDSGLPTTINWDLPEGFHAGKIQWPLPEKIKLPGEMENYGYSNEVLLMVKITPPKKIAVSEISLKAKTDWLVCKESCIPGDADIALKLPVAKNPKSAKPANHDLFAKYRAKIPKPPQDAPFKGNWERGKDGLILTLTGLKAKSVDFFPLPPQSLTLGHPKMLESAKSAKSANGEVKIKVPVDSMSSSLNSLGGVVVATAANGERTSWQIVNSEQGGAISAAPISWSTLAWNLLFGFIGGMILNVMPCVLPVIGLKIMGFVQQAGESRGRIFRLGLAFCAGIFAWFLALAALIVGFKMAGHSVNWAFQFQNPWFIGIMFVIVLAFALNLFGLFEIMLPSRANSRMMNAVSHEGYGGAFMHGLFATLLATPCTAPFLGSALGFAFAQSPAVIFIIFAAIAAGMSFPYFLLTAKPVWLKFLPRPGIWMVRVKQFMGVLLLITAIWLGWVLFQYFQPRKPFQPQLTSALQTNRTVFVDFTASWCVNCKVNEKLVLDTDAVKKAFAKHDVLVLKADWTAGAPDITKLLKHFGRAGVPLYVIYPKGAHDKPMVLPEVLTKDIVIRALNKAAGKAD